MYVTLTKKRLFVLVCAIVLSLVIIGQFFSVKAGETKLSTNAQRVQFIATLGIDLQSDNCEQKQVTIPFDFSKVYENYNTLQRSAGFDLAAFKGKNVTVYTYTATDGRMVNLMVYKDKLIGGDIADVKVGGEMSALKGNDDGKRTF